MAMSETVVKLRWSTVYMACIYEAAAMYVRSLKLTIRGVAWLKMNTIETTSQQINVNSRMLAKVIDYCTKHACVAEKTADKPKKSKVGPVKLMMTTKAKKKEEGSTSHAWYMSPEDHLNKWDAEFLNN